MHFNLLFLIRYKTFETGMHINILQMIILISFD